MTFESWLLFSLAVLAASISPGPNVLIVIMHSLKYGWKASIYTIVGNLSCLFLVALLAALGVGALIKAEPLAYTILKTAGAAYLIYMGIKIIRSSFTPVKTLVDLPAGEKQQMRPSGFALASQSFLTSASNPKAVLFLSAVFPQFLDQSASLTGQFVIMFSTIIVVAAIVHMTYAVMACKLRRKTMTPRARTFMSRLTGTTFIGLGGGVLVSD